MRGRDGVDAAVETIFKILDAQIGIGGGHAVVGDADGVGVRGGALGQNDAGARRGGEHGGKRARVHVRGMRVSAENQVRVGDFRGIERRREGTPSAGRRGEAGVDVEDDVVALDDEAAMAEPPEYGRFAVGLVDFGEKLGAFVYGVAHRAAALSRRSRMALQAGSNGGRSTAIQSQRSASASWSLA